MGWKDLQLWVAEFGAWDGKHLSNTFALVELKNFKAVYIEGDQAKFKKLKETAKVFPSIWPVNAMISSSPGSTNSLDEVLSQTEIPSNFDVLSIDIDSNDLDIWESLTSYEPKIVVIEINSGIMPGVLSRHNKMHDGNSFSSTLKVANEKGYVLACHTGNCIFVRKELISKLNIPQRYVDYPELLFRYEPMWFPRSVSLIRLIARKILPLRLKYLCMRGLELIRTSLIKNG